MFHLQPHVADFRLSASSALKSAAVAGGMGKEAVDECRDDAGIDEIVNDLGGGRQDGMARSG